MHRGSHRSRSDVISVQPIEAEQVSTLKSSLPCPAQELSDRHGTAADALFHCGAAPTTIPTVPRAWTPFAFRRSREEKQRIARRNQEDTEMKYGTEYSLI